MKRSARIRTLALSASLSLVLVGPGCDDPAVVDEMTKAKETVGDVSQNVAADVGDVVADGKAMAVELGEKAMTALAPLKEKIGNLDSLKDSPEKLKQAVSDLIAMIETKTAELELPEMVSKALATTKEKLVALKDYLEGTVEPAKVEEQIQGIKDSLSSAMGM